MRNVTESIDFLGLWLRSSGANSPLTIVSSVETNYPKPSLSSKKQCLFTKSPVQYRSSDCQLVLLKRMIMNDDLFEQFLIRCEPEVSSSAARHSRLRAKLIRFFAWKYCEDPEGLADETIGRLVAIVYGGDTIEQPSGYALGTARNVYREYIRKRAKLKAIYEDSESVMEEEPATADADPFVECAGLCFKRLPHDKRLLLEQYYSEDGNREELAGQEGLSLAGLRTKIHRLKAELKECYNECMRGSSS